MLLIFVMIGCSSRADSGGSLLILTRNFAAQSIKVNNVAIIPSDKEYHAELGYGPVRIEMTVDAALPPAVIEVFRENKNYRSRMIITRVENGYRVEYYETDSDMVEFHVVKPGEKIRLSWQ